MRTHRSVLENFMQYDDNVLFVGQGGGFLSVEAITGIYKAFEESGVIPGKARASSGAGLFSSLYYSGHNSDWMESVVKRGPVSDWIELSPIQAIKSIYGKSNYIIDNSKIRDLLQVEMNILATDRVELSVTRLGDYVSLIKKATPQWALAATSIPFVFPPVRAGKNLYGDGGVLNNIPLPSLAAVKKYKRVYVFLTPPTAYIDSEIPLCGLINLLMAVMEREVEQLKESGIFDLPNVCVLQCQDSFGGNLLKWSDDYKLMDAYYMLTKEKINA